MYIMNFDNKERREERDGLGKQCDGSFFLIVLIEREML